MKAVILSGYGPPATALVLQEVERPTPLENEVLLKVCATAVNDWDWCYTRGKPYAYRLMFGFRKPKVAVLGAEVAGIVEEVGSGVAKFKVGDEVYGDISEVGFGGFADYVCVSEAALARKPPSISFEQAAAAPHAAMLAWQGLVDVAHIREGESVLINGAGGGVGILGLQIAKKYGGQVSGVDRASKLNTLRSVGFDHVIDYHREDFTRSGRRYDVILDTKTTRSPFRLLACLKDGGRYVTVGGNLLQLLQVALMGPLIEKMTGKRFRVVSLKPNKDLSQLNELFEAGKLRSLIDGPHLLRDVPNAVQRFGDAKHIGKIVITVAAPSGERS